MTDSMFTPDSRNPLAIMEREFEKRRDYTDEQILADIKTMPVLPDEDICCTDEEEDDIWLYLALCDQARERGLRAALVPLLERASYGDPMETMRGLRHTLEAIVKQKSGEGFDDDVLVDAYITAMSSPNRGARLWATRYLGMFFKSYGERGRQALLKALDDSAELVREAARRNLGLED